MIEAVIIILLLVILVVIAIECPVGAIVGLLVFLGMVLILKIKDRLDRR